MKTIKEILQNSIHTGELINIIYNGGSVPGASRMIMPIAIEGNKIKARCYKTNTVKSFFLEKITLAESDKITYTGEHKEPETLIKALEPHLDELKRLGWELESNDIEAGLFTYYKNGKRRKMAAVGITDTNYGNVDPIARHWYVHGHAFKYLSKAIEKFMDFAREKRIEPSIT
jgi:hypothetical protein